VGRPSNRTAPFLFSSVSDIKMSMVISRYSHFLIAFFWVLGFFLSLPVVEPAEFARLGSVGFISLACFTALGVSLEQGLRLPKSPLFLVVALFWILAFLSIFWSAYRFASVISFATFSLLPLSFLSFVMLENSRRTFRYCAYGTGIILAGLAGWAVFQYLFLPEHLVWGFVRAPFANPNSYATLMGLGLFCGFSVLLSAKNHINQILSLVFCLLSVGALIFIGSRSVFLLCFLFLVVLFFFERQLFKEKKYYFLVFFLGAALFAFVPNLLNSDHHKTPLDRITSLSSGEDKSLGTRFDIWNSTAHMIREAPFVGRGLGTFHLFYPQVRAQTETSSSGYMAHSDPLQFWMEMGVLSPLLFYLFLVLVLWRMWLFMKAESPGQKRAFVSAVFCALGMLTVHTHISFDLYVASTLALAGLLLACWFSMTGKALGDDCIEIARPPSLPIAANWFFLMLPFLTGLFLLQGVLYSEYYSNRARQRGAEADIHAFTSDVNRAETMGFGWNARPYILATNLPLAVLEHEGSLLPFEKQQENYNQIKDLLDKAEAKNPRLASIPYYRAVALSLISTGDERSKKIETNLLKALQLDPIHLGARLMLADFYKDQGKTEDEWHVLKQGVRWRLLKQGVRPSYALSQILSYYERVAVLAAEKGDNDIHELAMRNIKIAEELKP